MIPENVFIFIGEIALADTTEKCMKLVANLSVRCYHFVHKKNIMLDFENLCTAYRKMII